jgi:predicted nucleic acid-binding protein
MRIALDTNVLAYAEGANDRDREAQAIRLTTALPSDPTFLAVQVLGELFNALVRRGVVRSRPRQVVDQWSSTFILIPTSVDLMSAAASFAAPAQNLGRARPGCRGTANCSVLLSEDFQNGFAWRGVTVCNPFLPKPHPLIAHLVRT